MNHDATHCADYDKRKCPKECYRAKLTAEVDEAKAFAGHWLSYAHFKGTQYCKREDKE